MVFDRQWNSNVPLKPPNDYESSMVTLSTATHKDSSGAAIVTELVKDDEGQKHLDQLLVRELNQLTLHERERVYEEIHGVSQSIEETPAFVQEKLVLMDQALQRIAHKPAYCQAWTQDASYCMNPKLRLAFLRAEYFDPPNAATRMVKFFEGKLEYFGVDALARDIRLEDDMDESDLECLQAGHLQFLPARDRSGRAVFCDFQAALPRCYKEARNMVKCFIYNMLCAAEDEENQKLGIVGILYHLGKQLNKPDPELLAQGPASVQWVPIRFTSLHICVNEAVSSLLARLLLIGAGKQLRTRSRVHYGTHTECQYSLLSFGVPVHVFPISTEGELKNVDFHKWIKKRKLKEDSIRRKGVFHGIDLPRNVDVLMGKGKPFQIHPGNVNLRHICESRLDLYNSSRKVDKAVLAIQVVEAFGKFLKKETDGWWYEVSQEVAKDKVIKAFLSARAVEKNLRPETLPFKSKPSAISMTERDNKRIRLCGM